MAANTKRNQQIAANRSNGQHATANFKDGSRYQSTLWQKIQKSAFRSPARSGSIAPRIPPSQHWWMDGKMILGLESLAHTYVFGRYGLPISKNYCALDGTETLLEIPTLLLGGNRSSWLSKARLCTASRDCTMERRSVWAVSAFLECWRKNLMLHESRFQYFM